MALTHRLSLAGPAATDPEDFFGDSLGVIFPDDVTNQHGDSGHGLVYASPHLPRPIALALADVEEEADRLLFSHSLWNSSLLIAEFIEAGTLGLGEIGGGGGGGGGEGGDDRGIPWDRGFAPPLAGFDVSGLSVMEMGAGTALPSIMAGLLGARKIVVTDYPAPAVIKTLKGNVAASVKKEFAPAGRFAVEEVLVGAHGWGELDTPLALENKHAIDRVIAADCLWMPWQHDNLRRSVSWFLGQGEDARAWVIAGFHTTRSTMREFFEREALAGVGLEVEHMWERDCNGQDREWAWDRGIEDVTLRKRWLAVGVLKRIRKPAAEGETRP